MSITCLSKFSEDYPRNFMRVSCWCDFAVLVRVQSAAAEFSHCYLISKIPRLSLYISSPLFLCCLDNGGSRVQFLPFSRIPPGMNSGKWPKWTKNNLSHHVTSTTRHLPLKSGKTWVYFMDTWARIGTIQNSKHWLMLTCLSCVYRNLQRYIRIPGYVSFKISDKLHTCQIYMVPLYISDRGNFWIWCVIRWWWLLLLL